MVCTSLSVTGAVSDISVEEIRVRDTVTDAFITSVIDNMQIYFHIVLRNNSTFKEGTGRIRVTYDGTIFAEYDIASTNQYFPEPGTTKYHRLADLTLSVGTYNICAEVV